MKFLPTFQQDAPVFFASDFKLVQKYCVSYLQYIPIHVCTHTLIHYIRRYTLVAVNTCLLNYSSQVALIRLSQSNEASFSGNMRPCGVSIVNGDGWRMGKVAVLLVTLTCLALLPRCHSQGEVRVTECKGCTL